MSYPKRQCLAAAAFLVLACWAAPASVSAQQMPSSPTLTLNAPVTAPPRIDGRLNDACWQDAAQTTGFMLHTRRQPASEQTTVYVTYDRRTLYVAFECLESRMDLLAARIKDRDGQIFKDDVVEVFVDPNRDRFTYYQFAANPLGTRFDLKGDAAGANAAWDTPWDAVASLGEDRWFVEMAIPFSSLDIHAGKTGDTWGINFAREQKPAGELSVWSFTGGAFAQPDRFGDLIGLDVEFARFAYGIEIVSPGEKLVGNNVLRARLTAPKPGKARVGLEIWLPDGQSRQKEVPVEFRGQQPAEVFLPYELPREGHYRMVLRVRDIQDGEILHAAGVAVSVPPLLELALYPNHYRQEVWLRARLNVRDTDLKEFRLAARLYKGDALVPPAREIARFVVKEPSLPFDLSKSGPGDYEIRVTLAPTRGGAILAQQTLKFGHTALAGAENSGHAGTARPRPAPPTSIDYDNTLLVKGQRFFPIGIYRYGNLSDRSLRELRDAGFNLVQAPLADSPAETQTVLDHLQAHGLMGWVSLNDLMDLGDKEDARRKRLAAVVPALSKHPALLCWESVDEPAWAGRSADSLYRGYRALRALDAQHPVWMNHAPRNTVDELARFNMGADIAGADIYPVPEPQTQSDLPNKSVAVVGDETSKNTLAVLNRKPVFMVLQGFAWADLSRRQGGTAVPVYPTLEQSRFMAYHAVVRGARGLLYWGANYTPKPSPFWNDLRRVVHELSQMKGVFAGPNTGDSAQVLAGKGIETIMRRYPHSRSGDRFLIAVNASAQPAQNVRIQVPGAMPKVVWRVLFEKRTVSGNPIVDSFEPYGVHVYTASTRFPQEQSLDLPDVADTQRPRPEDLTQEGNLLINPGFEYVEGSDDAPVGWDLRPSFSGSVTTEVRRTGKYSLHLRGRGGDTMPLWMQTGVSTEKGRKYRLSAYVRARPAGTQYRLYAEWTDANNKYVSGHVPAQWNAGTETWQQRAQEFTVTQPEAKRLYVVLQVRGEGEAWFDDVCLEEAP